MIIFQLDNKSEMNLCYLQRYWLFVPDTADDFAKDNDLSVDTLPQRWQSLEPELDREAVRGAVLASFVRAQLLAVYALWNIIITDHIQCSYHIQQYE